MGGQRYGAVICLAEASYPRANKPEEWRGAFGVVEKVGEIESEEGKVVCRVHAGVYIPQEPLVVVHYSLSCRCIIWKSIAVIAGT